MSISLTSADSGKTLQLNSGDIFSIELPENPTTGYLWAIQAIDKQILELQGSDYSAPINTGIGGGGQHRFTFRAKALGTTHLQLKEWREWEGDRSINHQFAVTVQVQ